MESSNLQHQLQELFVGYSNSLVSPPPPIILGDGNSYNNPYLVDQSLACSRENENLWFNFSSNYQLQQQPNDHEHGQHQLSTLYSSIHQSSPTLYGAFHGISAAAGSNNNNNNNTNYYYNNHGFSSSSRNNNSNCANSTLDLLSSSSFSSSMGYNLQADHRHLDFLSAAPTYNSSAFHKTTSSSSPLFGYGLQHLQDSLNNNTPSNSSNKCKLICDTPNNLQASSTSHVARAKRPVNSLGVPKKSNNSESSKKSCSTSRSSSCPPLKVRKEKLGDRVSALQRLVAPFGKTDTSSVLTEAIGYIQFLHDQVETLSMPYLASSQTKPYQKLHPGSIIQEDNGNGTKPARQDLRSRGLCLMPLSCASFIHGYD